MKSHNGEKPIKCDFPKCFYATAQSTKLARHKAAIHKIGIKYVCSFCGKGFYDDNDYSKHLNSHDKKNSNKKFSAKYKLKIMFFILLSDFVQDESFITK